MTDIDFRRIASLLFALKFIGLSRNWERDAVEAADKLLEEIRRDE